MHLAYSLCKQKRFSVVPSFTRNKITKQAEICILGNVGTFTISYTVKHQNLPSAFVKFLVQRFLVYHRNYV